MVQSTAKATQEMSEAIMHLAKNLANVYNGRNEEVLGLVEKQKENTPDLKTLIRGWADAIMEECDKVLELEKIDFNKRNEIGCEKDCIMH